MAEIRTETDRIMIEKNLPEAAAFRNALDKIGAQNQTEWQRSEGFDEILNLVVLDERIPDLMADIIYYIEMYPQLRAALLQQNMRLNALSVRYRTAIDDAERRGESTETLIAQINAISTILNRINEKLKGRGR